MNIQMQICGLCIMFLLLYFCLRQKSLWMRNEKIFLFTLIVSIVCVCLDISSIVAIVNRRALPPWLLNAICKTYLVSLVAVGFTELEYTNLNLKKQREYPIRIGIMILLGVTAALSIFVLPIYYFREGKTVYTYGPSVVATYVYAMTCILLTIYKLIRFGKKMNHKRARAIWLWMIIWCAAAVIQGLNNQYLLVGFAMAMGMLILFFELENPEANMDRLTGVFNSHALTEFVKQKYRNGESFCIFSICVDQEQQYERIQGEIFDYLNSVPKARVFKRADDEIMLLFEKEEELEAALGAVRERFRRDWGRDGVNITYMITPVYLVLRDSSLAKNAEEMLRIFSISKAENENNENRSVIYIDEGMVARVREREVMARPSRKRLRMTVLKCSINPSIP